MLGTMKYAMRSRPSLSRPRRYAPISAVVPTARDIAGSSAADMAMPKRLIGRTYIVWAYVNDETAPFPR